MAGRNRAEELKILSRRSQIANLFLQGVTKHHEIAQRLNMDRSTVTRDLKHIVDDWKLSIRQTVDEAKAKEIAKVDHLEQVAWEAWHRSCQAAETLYAGTTKGRTDKDGAALPDLVKTHKISKGQAGDPRFLERVGWCVERRCKLLGLDAPEKNELTITVEERRNRLAGILVTLRERAAAGEPGIGFDGITGGNN